MNSINVRSPYLQPAASERFPKKLSARARRGEEDRDWCF